MQVKMTSPTGEVFDIDEHRVEKLKRRGWKIKKTTKPLVKEYKEQEL